MARMFGKMMAYIAGFTVIAAWEFLLYRFFLGRMPLCWQVPFICAFFAVPTTLFLKNEVFHGREG